MVIKGLKFVKTCDACPEQYDVTDSIGRQVGYVRLRYGGLRCDYPDVGGETIYYADLDDEWLGEFRNEKERKRHLNAIADKLLEKIKVEN